MSGAPGSGPRISSFQRCHGIGTGFSGTATVAPPTVPSSTSLTTVPTGRR
jgi:hypothetical protein